MTPKKRSQLKLAHGLFVLIELLESLTKTEREISFDFWNTKNNYLTIDLFSDGID